MIFFLDLGIKLIRPLKLSILQTSWGHLVTNYEFDDEITKLDVIDLKIK
jgi:hypothetical protein